MGAVSEDVRLESVSDDKGAIVDTLTITRTNHGTPGDAQTGIKNIDYVRVLVPTGSELLTADGFEKPADSYFQKPDDTLQASAMLSAVEGRMRQGTNGTDVSDESGLTAFGNWIQVAPGESRTVTLSYRLPFRLADLASTPTSTWDKAKDAIGAYVPLADWKLVVRRQAGTRDRTFSTLARLPNGWTVKSQVPDALTVNGEGIAWHGPLDRDLYLGAVLADQK